VPNHAKKNAQKTLIRGVTALDVMNCMQMPSGCAAHATLAFPSCGRWTGWLAAALRFDAKCTVTAVASALQHHVSPVEANPDGVVTAGQPSLCLNPILPAEGHVDHPPPPPSLPRRANCHSQGKNLSLSACFNGLHACSLIVQWTFY